MNMIRKIQLLRSIGMFDSVSTGAGIDFGRLVLVYAENGRGKTTLAAVLRSIATNDPSVVMERHRLGSSDPPHVVLNCGVNAHAAVFENGKWKNLQPNVDIAVYDDIFVDENVYSGLTVDVKHRKQLHELVLGAKGVDLSKQLQSIISQIEIHNVTLNKISAQIKDLELHGVSVDVFCDLPEQQDIDTQIQKSERLFAAAKDQENVHNTPLFDSLDMPIFKIDYIEKVLACSLADLDAAAEAQVRAHINTLNGNGEQWISGGMLFVQKRNYKGLCPFCAQDLRGSSILDHYRAYFSENYSKIKNLITNCLETVSSEHGGTVRTAFERSIRVSSERHLFWSRFCEIPEISIDTAKIMQDWDSARKHVIQALQMKQAAHWNRKRSPMQHTPRSPYTILTGDQS